ncbi:MAG: hypothetical protein ABH878_09765 [bacterium]
MAVRVILTVLVLALVGFPCWVIATESGPSNTVGFWKMNVYQGYNHVSFPLLPEDQTVNNVLGDQLTGGATQGESDQVLRWDASTGQYQICWYNSSTGNWQGGFSTFSEAESYWIYVPSNHPTQQTVVTYGNVVEESSFDMGVMIPGYNAVGSVWATSASIANAGLTGFQGGMYLFLSDLIMNYDANSGDYTYAWKTDGGIWQGSLNSFEPLKGYWLYIAPGHTGFDWSDYPQPIGGMLNGTPQGSFNNNPAPFSSPMIPPPLPAVKGGAK